MDDTKVLLTTIKKRSHMNNLRPIWRVVAIVAVLWTVSGRAYYLLVEALGLQSGYNDAPVPFAAFYLAWATIALWLFRDVVILRLPTGRILREIAVITPMLVVFWLFVAYGLPLLPTISLVLAPETPPEFMFASAWYYLPKSADILFQQVLIAAVILTAAREGIKLSHIMIGMALAFGSSHLLLAYDGFSSTYVARFSVAATAFGVLLPYLYLRAKHGFRWAYGLHWSGYAVDATMTHFILAGPPWVQM